MGKIKSFLTGGIIGAVVALMLANWLLNAATFDG